MGLVTRVVFSCFIDSLSVDLVFLEEELFVGEVAFGPFSTSAAGPPDNKSLSTCLAFPGGTGLWPRNSTLDEHGAGSFFEGLSLSWLLLCLGGSDLLATNSTP